MNLLCAGGGFLGAMLLAVSGPETPKAPVETTTISSPVDQSARRPEQPSQSSAQAGNRPAQNAAHARPPEDRGWMTRETSVDRKTGETTEISVIGFAD